MTDKNIVKENATLVIDSDRLGMRRGEVVDAIEAELSERGINADVRKSE